MNQTIDLQDKFGGAKFEQGIDPSKVIEKSIYTYNEPIKTFEQYGHLLYPILVRNNYTRIGFGSGYYHWEQEGKFKKFLTDLQAKSFYPHEEVTTQLTDLFEGELKDSGMKIKTRYDSHAGFSGYWECVSDRFDTTIKDSYRVGDVVQVGMIVRNGIGTSVALGIDFFTNCLTCANGAVAKGKDLGTFSISHATNYKDMKTRFLQAIPDAIKHAKKLIEYYQKSAYIRLNQKIAEEIYDKTYFTEKYYPDYFGIDPEERKKAKQDKKKSLGEKVVNFKTSDNITLWQAFNDMTAELWHSDRLQFSGKRGLEIRLHNELISLVNRSKV
jgi:hypothetical protein